MVDLESTGAERKNLVVLSVIIILYYAAGGHIDDGTDNVSLGFINVAFSNPELISYFVWVILWWFAIRFYQIIWPEYLKRFSEEIESSSKRGLLYTYFIDRELEVMGRHRGQGYDTYHLFKGDDEKK